MKQTAGLLEPAETGAGRQTDPFERAPITSNTYWDWVLDHIFLIYPMTPFVSNYLKTYEEFPPAQKAASRRRPTTSSIESTTRTREVGLMKTLQLFVSLALVAAAATTHADDPLPSWNDGPIKKAIVGFVERITARDSPDYVPPAERIATFDNDGTLWSEQPVYFQLLFAIDRVKQLAAEHPEWKNEQPFKAVLDNDMEALTRAGEEGLIELVTASHAGMTALEFEQTVKDWLATARHARFNVPYTRMVFQPMLELLAYLRANGFKTYIVSGGGIEFMRIFAEDVYGIPPEQVIGSTIKTKFELRDGQPVIVRLPELDFIDDKAGKPIGSREGNLPANRCSRRPRTMMMQEHLL